MNRRRFIQSLGAVFTLPAVPSLSLGSATAAVPAAAAVPAKARFWAIYMSALHGECTPKTLQNLLHIPEVDAKNYIGNLIADGVIKPNPLLQRSVSNIMNSKEDGLLDKVKKRMDMKAQTGSREVSVRETVDAAECLEADADASEELLEESLDEDTEDDREEVETEVTEVTEVQNQRLAPLRSRGSG